VTATAHDVIVVGAGIVGAACAAALAEDGRRVLVIDQSFAAGAATAAGMGHLVVMDDSPEQLALTSYSCQLWRELAPTLPSSAEYQSCGTLWIAEDDVQLHALHEKASSYAQAGISSELLDEASLREAEPHLRRGLPGALRVSSDGVVYQPRVVLALLERVVARGGRLREHCSVEELVPFGVRLRGGELLRSDLVIVAAGAHTTSLVPELPIVPRKGHLAVTDRHPGLCRHQLVELGYLASAHVMTNESVAFNVQPRATGQVLIGSSRELTGWDASVNRRVLHRMLDRAREMIPLLADVSVLRIWTGFRPATPDKLPIIGPWDAVPGVWIAAGHEGLGVTTALGTARMIADLVANRETAISAAPFTPARATSRHAAEVSA
jgi:D-hydroxyproline dehydrogenase subunit beta